MKKLKSILPCIIFLAGLIVLLAGLSTLLEYKGSREKIRPFMDRAKQIDVLFFGDSHTSSDIYPMKLWKDYGITSYNLASYNVTIPISYWMMRNALTICHPKLIVLDVNQVWEQAKLCESSSDVHTALDGFPLSRTKLDAIWDLMDDPMVTDKSGLRYMDLRPEFVFPLIKYHARWNDLSGDDLHPDYAQELGAERNIAVAVPDDYEITSAVADEQGFGFIYLRRFIEYCRSADIDVMLTNLPYPCRNNSDEQLYTNAVMYTAEEYGVEYIDFVYLDQIADYSTDCYDPGSHLNPSGAWKVTDFIGQHISETYHLPDHRGDAAYAAWDRGHHRHLARKLESIRSETEPYSFMMLLADPSFSAVILLPKHSAVYTDELAMRLVQNAGRRHLMMADTDDAVWSDSLMPLEKLLKPADGFYLAVLDRAGASVGECRGSGTIQTSFGDVSLSEKGTATIHGKGSPFHMTVPPGKNMHAAFLDRETGEVLYDRTL